MTDNPRRRILAHPVPEEVPPVVTGHQFRAGVRRFRYRQLLHDVRQHPGRAYAIAVFDGPTVAGTQRKAETDRRQIQEWLLKYFPLEHWSIQVRRTPDTWAERKVYATYHGVISEFERERIKAETRAKYDDNQRKGEERRAMREARKIRNDMREAEEFRREQANRR